MSEKYNIAVEKSQISFTLYVGDIPDVLLKGSPMPADYAIFCRMGDPELMECVVWRKTEEAGGVFVLRAGGQALYAAVAENELAFSLALGYFGDLAAKARYGADIFEHMDKSDA